MCHPLIAIRFLATDGGAENRITAANLSLNPRKVNEPKVPCHGTKVTGLGSVFEVKGYLRNRWRILEFPARAVENRC